MLLRLCVLREHRDLLVLCEVGDNLRMRVNYSVERLSNGPDVKH